MDISKDAKINEIVRLIRKIEVNLNEADYIEIERFGFLNTLLCSESEQYKKNLINITLILSNGESLGSYYKNVLDLNERIYELYFVFFKDLFLYDLLIGVSNEFIEKSNSHVSFKKYKNFIYTRFIENLSPEIIEIEKLGRFDHINQTYIAKYTENFLMGFGLTYGTIERFQDEFNYEICIKASFKESIDSINQIAKNNYINYLSIHIKGHEHNFFEDEIDDFYSYYHDLINDIQKKYIISRSNQKLVFDVNIGIQEFQYNQWSEDFLKRYLYENNLENKGLFYGDEYNDRLIDESFDKMINDDYNDQLDMDQQSQEFWDNL